MCLVCLSKPINSHIYCVLIWFKIHQQDNYQLLLILKRRWQLLLHATSAMVIYPFLPNRSVYGYPCEGIKWLWIVTVRVCSRCSIFLWQRFCTLLTWSLPFSGFSEKASVSLKTAHEEKGIGGPFLFDRFWPDAVRYALQYISWWTCGQKEA